MRILFTGASSFTGYWFAKELTEAGHEVAAIFRKPLDSYSGMRRERVEQLQNLVTSFFGVSFGTESFLDVVREGKWHVLCHHAADVTNYKSDDFDCLGAVANNTHNLSAVLSTISQQKCQHVMLTGSVFEQREGVGSRSLPAFSPYGLSKGLTYDIASYYCSKAGVALGKFVIPNPFGPYEELRFTTYLATSWLQGKAARCDFPHYVRDNIHVSLLAKAYAHYVAAFVANQAPSHYAPSGYPESQGAFTLRFAREMEKRIGISCPVEMPDSHSFPEPAVRLNSDRCEAALLGWSENTAWEELATFYRSHYA